MNDKPKSVAFAKVEQVALGGRSNAEVFGEIVGYIAKGAALAGAVVGSYAVLGKGYSSWTRYVAKREAADEADMILNALCGNHSR